MQSAELEPADHVADLIERGICPVESPAHFRFRVRALGVDRIDEELDRLLRRHLAKMEEDATVLVVSRRNESLEMMSGFSSWKTVACEISRAVRAGVGVAPLKTRPRTLKRSNNTRRSGGLLRPLDLTAIVSRAIALRRTERILILPINSAYHNVVSIRRTPGRFGSDRAR
jgi:hypothetical protein